MEIREDHRIFMQYLGMDILQKCICREKQSRNEHRKNRIRQESRENFGKY